MNSLALAVIAVLLPAVAAAAPRTPVSERIAVSGDEVTLADLVPGAPAAWGRVALGKAPLPGGQRVLNRDWVLARARSAGADSTLDLPETVVLTRAGQTVEREAVVRAVQTVLAGTGGQGKAVRVSAVGLPGPVPPGEITLAVAEPEGNGPGPATVWVDVLAGGRKVGRAWARIEAGTGDEVLVLGRSARRGEVLGPEDVELAPSKAGARGRALNDVSDAVGKRLVRSLSAGMPLTAADLETPPAVAKGDLVRLVARVGSVTAVTAGKALEAGRLGEGIRVENPSSGRTVQGILRERGVVDVLAE